MISEKIQELINKQINKEFYSGYLYLSMSTVLKELGLFGFAHCTRNNARDKVEQGLQLLDYLLDCHSFVTLKQIQAPEYMFDGVANLFKRLYKHEKSITESILEITRVLQNECDIKTYSFMNIYLEKQQSKEKNIEYIAKKMEQLGNDNTSLTTFDNMLYSQ